MTEDRFQKQLEAHSETELTPDTQERLNTPLEKPMDPELATYLSQVEEMLDQGIVNVYTPSSLLKTDLFETLSEQDQARVELAAANLCGLLRQMQDLRSRGQQQSFQMELLIQNIFLTKERLEESVGDVLHL